jgi:ribosomal protein L15
MTGARLDCVSGARGEEGAQGREGGRKGKRQRSGGLTRRLRQGETRPDDERFPHENMRMDFCTEKLSPRYTDAFTGS